MTDGAYTEFGRDGREMTTAESTWVICAYYLDSLKIVKHVEGDYAVWPCGECGNNSLIAKFVNGDAGCVTEGCEVPAWMNQLKFIAYFDSDIEDNDTRAANKRRKAILGEHLEHEREEAMIQESEERQELEARLEKLEADNGALRQHLSTANQSVDNLKGRVSQEISNRDEWKQSAEHHYGELQEARRKLETGVVQEGANAGLVLGIFTLPVMWMWLYLFLERAGVALTFRGVILLLIISIGYAVLAGMGFYQSSKRAYTERREWDPFYKRIVPQRILAWFVEASVMLVLPYIVAGWVLELEPLTSRVPPGETAWTLLGGVIAMILPVLFVSLASND